MSVIIFGYGTFITLKFYENEKDVAPAFLPDHFRVYPFSLSWIERDPNHLRRIQNFPYILKDDGKNYNNIKSGFWGLIFTVPESRLPELDYYEDVGGLYIRKRIRVTKVDGKVIKAFTYYPTEKSIKRYRLSDNISRGDMWRELIINYHPDMIKEFPQLGL